MKAANAARKRKADGKPVRTQDPQGTKQNILDIASEEFALNGLSGARIDEIAARTRSSKRMIYYYFGDKEGLYLSALENAYRLVREGEAKLDIEGLSPTDALTRLVEFTFDHHHRHEEFIRMVMIENIHHGQYLDRSKAIRDLNVTAIDYISRILCARGRRKGVQGWHRPSGTPLAGQRSLLLQRFEPRHVLEDFRTRLRRSRRPETAANELRRDGSALRDA